MRKVWADAGYSSAPVEEVRERMDWDLEIVTRAGSHPTDAFAVQPHRWIVERTIA